ncbi:diguanylate cyclase (GGDEF)-like protein [Anaerospora hongkongensis]|uniref:Diguanylate cyclase (GGDEF)-like protein n=1 Tax=Anaerospora hongkongensis TaxID=244830 RepID=A0A4R1PY40_9FIRM|nr:GGDEF domain-containing protein [Anaerospora hongkongensis]TCL37701.1 diguanylate cyclase (GGDEF)-like protein [Anaerospora hongkongensis]
MTFLDTYTIYFLTLLGNLIMLLMLAIFARTTGFEGLMRFFIYGKLLQTIGAALGLFRGLIPVDLSIILGNSFVYLGGAVEVFCIVYVDKMPLAGMTKRWFQIAAAITAGFILLYLAGANTGTRVFVSAMILAGYSLAAAAGLCLCKQTTSLRKTLAVFFVVLAVSQIVRALDALPRGADYPLFAASSLQMISFISIYMHTLISTMAYLLISREVTDIKLKKAATRDYLTGIYNRMQFIQLSEKLLSLMIRQKKPTTVFMIDFDFFKVINDTYGHDAGDRVLIHFSQKVQSIIRNEDLFGRYGGEEFIIFAPNTTAEAALAMGGKIKAVIQASLDTDTTIPGYTVSIGTATVIPAYLADMDTLIVQADQALLTAKRNGRDQIVQFAVDGEE